MPLIENQPARLYRNPRTANSQHALHRHLDRASSNYTYTHALVTCVSGQDVVGRLPEVLTLSWDFVDDVGDMITPPVEHWNKLDQHLRDHYRKYRAYYDEAFHVVVNRLEAIYQDVQRYAPDSPEEQEEHAYWINDLRSQHQMDGEYAYAHLPDLFIQLFVSLRNYMDLLATVPPVLQQEFDVIEWYLAYPYSDENSYSLNVKFPVRCHDRDREFVFQLLFAYRLGRSQIFMSRGSESNAVYLERDGVKIASLHERIHGDIIQRHRADRKLLCRLNFC